MQFEIEDIVEYTAGDGTTQQGTISSFKNESEIVIIPLGKGMPLLRKASEIKLIFSFFKALAELRDDAQLQAILSRTEAILKDVTSKEKPKTERASKAPIVKIEL
jgi:hypothetical protein